MDFETGSPQDSIISVSSMKFTLDIVAFMDSDSTSTPAGRYIGARVGAWPTRNWRLEDFDMIEGIADFSFDIQTMYHKIRSTKPSLKIAGFKNLVCFTSGSLTIAKTFSPTNKRR